MGAWKSKNHIQVLLCNLLHQYKYSDICNCGYNCYAWIVLKEMTWLVFFTLECIHVGMCLCTDEYLNVVKLVTVCYEYATLHIIYVSIGISGEHHYFVLANRASIIYT